VRKERGDVFDGCAESGRASEREVGWCVLHVSRLLLLIVSKTNRGFRLASNSGVI